MPSLLNDMIDPVLSGLFSVGIITGIIIIPVFLERRLFCKMNVTLQKWLACIPIGILTVYCVLIIIYSLT